MAAGAWTFYDMAKEYLMDGTLDLDTDIFRVALFKSASNAATATLSAYTELTSQVANANGYTTNGKTLSATVWITGASASERRFDATAVFWSANGGSISAIKYAVIYKSGTNQLLCYSQLSSAQFSVTDTNRLTITPAAGGIFELN